MVQQIRATIRTPCRTAQAHFGDAGERLAGHSRIRRDSATIEAVVALARGRAAVIEHKDRYMHVMILGLRGIPGVQGGIETHVEQLAPLLARNGVEVEVITRASYGRGEREWNGVRLTPIWAPRTDGVEALVHTLLGILYAAIKRPDLLHIHAVGPMLMVPVARFLGLRVVVTHHGPDYDREKWGPLARRLLRLGERVGVKYSQGRIAISKLIQHHLWTAYGCKSTLIKNGVGAARPGPGDPDVLRRFGLDGARYVLQVSRFVPEKRQTDLIRAFRAAGLPGWKLALVGDVSGKTAYEREVRELCRDDPDVVLTGYRSGDELDALYAHAGLFVLPSSHEGLPIAMLEALSYGLRVVASDIGPNLEVGLARGQYYPLGDVQALAGCLRSEAEHPPGERDRAAIREWVLREYNWEEIAASTVEVYRSVADAGLVVEA